MLEKKEKPLFKHPLFFLLLFGLTLLFTGGYFVYITYAPHYVGALTEATLLEKETVEEGEKTPAYFLVYRFEDYNKKVHEGRVEVSRSLFTKKEKGEVFPLSFMPDDPGMVYVPGSKGAMISAVLMIFGLAISLISGFGLGMSLTAGSGEREESGKPSRDDLS